MDNKVGDNAPDAATGAKLLTDLTAIVAQLAAFCITLGKAERKRLLHARLGAEPHIARIHELAAQYKIDIDNIPLKGMLADLALFTLLRPIQDLLRTALRMIEDTSGQAESEAWEAFLAYYGALCGMAKHVPALATALAPTIAFMATGPRAKPPAAPAGGTPGGG